MPSTRDVLDHHLQCFGCGDLEGILADYTADSALLTPDGAVRGVPAIREFFARAFAEFQQPGTTMTMHQLIVRATVRTSAGRPRLATTGTRGD